MSRIDQQALRAHGLAERQDILHLFHDLSPQEWEVPSLCAGWRVRDVAAHLLVEAPHRELGWAFVARRMLAWRFDIDRINAWWVEHNATVPIGSLIAAFERELEPGPMGHFLRPVNSLRAALIHHEDMRRPLGRPSVAPPERIALTLDSILTPWGSKNLGSRERARGFRLIATDLDWSAGSGPVVEGPGLALLMTVAGRPGYRDRLTGDGAAAFARESHAPVA